MPQLHVPAASLRAPATANLVRVLQHDRNLIRAVDAKTLVAILRSSEDVNMVSLLTKTTIHHSIRVQSRCMQALQGCPITAPEWAALAEPRLVGGVRLIRMLQWLDSTHIAKVSSAPLDGCHRHRRGHALWHDPPPGPRPCPGQPPTAQVRRRRAPLASPHTRSLLCFCSRPPAEMARQQPRSAALHCVNDFLWMLSPRLPPPALRPHGIRIPTHSRADMRRNSGGHSDVPPVLPAL